MSEGQPPQQPWGHGDPWAGAQHSPGGPTQQHPQGTYGPAGPVQPPYGGYPPGGPPPPPHPPQRPKSKLPLVLGLGAGAFALLLVVVGAGTTWFVLRGDSDSPNSPPMTGVVESREGGSVRFTAAQQGLPTVEIYLDFQCPHCRHLHEQTGPTVHQLIQQGKAQVVFRPIGALGPSSAQTAAASLCAADASEFLPYAGALFANQAELGNPSSQQLVELGKDAGISSDSFAECVRSGRHEGTVRQATQRALASGVRGIPTVLVNGTEVGNVISPEELRRAVRQAG